MGVHQEFAGCLVRMGCNASDRTTSRYACVSLTVIPKSTSPKFAAAPSSSLFTLLSLHSCFKITRLLCIHAVTVLSKNTHLQSLLLSADLEKVLFTSRGIFLREIHIWVLHTCWAPLLGVEGSKVGLPGKGMAGASTCFQRHLDDLSRPGSLKGA